MIDAEGWVQIDRVAAVSLSIPSIYFAIQVASIGVWYVAGIALLLIIVSDFADIRKSRPVVYVVVHSIWHGLVAGNLVAVSLLLRHQS